MLIPVDLSQALYTAVSYTWGTEERSKWILVDDKWFAVRPNLWQLLSDLRDKERLRTLWIDAICINQDSDTAERNFQVSLMGDIFRNAVGVIAWISTPQEDSRLRQEIIRAAKLLCSQHRDDYVVECRYEEEAVDLLKVLLEHRYFTRRWVIQEAVLARSVTVHCGEFGFPSSWIPGFTGSGNVFDDHGTPSWALLSQAAEYVKQTLAARLVSLHGDGTFMEDRKLRHTMRKYFYTE